MNAQNQMMNDKDEDFDFDVVDSGDSEVQETVVQTTSYTDARRRLEEYREQREMERLLRDDFEDFDDD